MRIKNLALICGIMTSLFLMGCNASKTAVINTNLAFQSSAASQAGLEHLNKMGEALQANLDQAEKDLQASKDKKNKAEFQAMVAAAQQQISAEQQSVIAKVGAHLRQSMDDYRKKNGISMIIDAAAAVSYDPKSDVTEAIISEMNKTPITFEQK